MSPPRLPDITLIGHPHEPIGMGEYFRAVLRAIARSGLSPSVYDVYQRQHREASMIEDLGLPQAANIGEGIRIFVLNGDEIEPATRAIEARTKFAFEEGYNIVCPAWELPRYPAIWARELNRFDEVWTLSRFTYDALRPELCRPVQHMSVAVEPRVRRFSYRRSFGIPEHRYAILSFFDVLSYASRKNPWSAIETFRRALKSRPYAQAHLVLKVSNSEREPGLLKRLQEELAPLGDRATIVDRILPSDEMKNLIRLCDCYLSLHRSEGFGFGSAEAMYFERPAIATGWSGNMDFMMPGVSFPIGYRLVPVKEGEYPHWEDQEWAEPDIDEAAQVLGSLIDDPIIGMQVGRRAGIHMRTAFSYRAIGLRYRRRLEAIADELQKVGVQ